MANFSSISALASKDLRLLVRDRSGFFFVFIFPVVFAVFFGAIFSGQGGGGDEKKLDIVLVDADGSESSRSFADELRATPELRVQTGADEEAGRKAVLARQAVAYLMIPAGYGKAQQQLFVGDPPTLTVGIDPSRQMESGMLQGVIQKVAFGRFGRQMMDPKATRPRIAEARASIAAATAAGQKVPADLGEFLTSLDKFMQRNDASDQTTQAGATATGGFAFEPVRVSFASVQRAKGGGPTNAYEVSFPQAMIWGMMGCAMGFASSLLTERTHGTLARLLASPLSRASILLGKAAACLVTTLGVCVFMLAFGALVFGVRLANSPMLLAAVVCVSLGFVGIMMLIASLARSEASASGIGWGILMVLAMLGGAAVPLFAMPQWMQGLSSISPIKWAILALEGGLWRGFGPAEMLLPCAVMLALGLAGFVIGITSFRWEASRS